MFKTLKQKLIYENPWIRLWEDDVEFRGGRQGIYAYLEKKGPGPLMIPMTDDGKLLVLREWRYPIKDWTYCFPAGSVDEGESSIETAKRELLEETGYTGAEWIDLGQQYVDPGGTTQHGPVYLVRGLQKQEELVLEDTENHEVLFFSFDEIDAKIVDGTMNNAWLLAGYAKVLAYLKK